MDSARLTKFRVGDHPGEEDLSVAFVADGEEERVVDDHVEWQRLDSDSGGGLGSFFIDEQEGRVADLAGLERARSVAA